MDNSESFVPTKFMDNNDDNKMQGHENSNIIHQFIVIDDDPINNIICSKLIKKALGDPDVKTIAIPEDGLDYIENEFSKSADDAILFLDINMPTLSGWEFMERYHNFSEEIRKRITVYILSSSMDHRDIERAKADPGITGFLSKPLDMALVRSLASRQSNT
jgi:response regulator RpfG family c-di-GMP phosphodiesterase